MMPLLAGVVAYVLGAIPFGYLLVRLKTGGDIRAQGSGNIGATNVMRASGVRAGVLVALLDMLKGALSVLLAERLSPSAAAPAVAGFAAIVGHIYPIWLRFRGGKGVATGLGVSLALAPWAAVAGGATWVVLYKIFKISSLGSLAGVAVSLAVAAFTADRSAVYGLAAVSAVILVRHTGNIRRLLRKQES